MDCKNHYRRIEDDYLIDSNSYDNIINTFLNNNNKVKIIGIRNINSNYILHFD